MDLMGGIEMIMPPGRLGVRLRCRIERTLGSKLMSFYVVEVAVVDDASLIDSVLGNATLHPRLLHMVQM
jgi:hypothetical protein